MATSRNPFFFGCFEQRNKPSPSPVFPAFTNLGQTGGTKGASNAIRCRFFRSPARHFPLPLYNSPFRPASSLCGTHLLFSLCSACCCQKRLGNAEIRLSLGTCFRQEAKLLACRLFALLHASLPGVPDLPTLRHILIRHLFSMQGKDVSEYGKRGPRKTALPCSISQAPAMTVTNSQEMQEASRLLLLLVIGNQHIRPQGSLHLPRRLFVRIPVFIHYPNKLQQKFPSFPLQGFLEHK